jgi:hypothetical protein
MSSIMGQTKSPDTITEGRAPAFRPSHTQAPLLLRTMIDDLVTGQRPSPSLDTESSLGLTACLEPVAKMPRTPFLQPTFHVTSTR